MQGEALSTLLFWWEQTEEAGKQRSLISQFAANEGQQKLLPLYVEGTKEKNQIPGRHLNGTGATWAAPGRQGSAEFTS